MKTIILKGVLAVIITVASTFIQTNNIYSQNSRDQISIARLDKDLLQYIEKPSTELTKSLIDKYPHTLPALALTINNEGQQSKILPSLATYFSHPALKKIYKEAVNKFSNIEDYEKSLSQMSLIARNELGVTKLPKFSVHVSGFKENTIYIDNSISLSIDKYMGSDYPAYKGYFRDYQLQQMQPKMIIRDFTKAWLMADYIKTETTNGDLLSEIIEHGKLLYALSILLPEYTEHDLMGYTSQEYNWCINNHKRVWDSIVKQNHLYTIDRHIIYAYLDENPNNQTTPKGSPGQVGSWIGLQIVKQYAKENKQSLKSILNTDSREILKNAKYRQ